MAVIGTSFFFSRQDDGRNKAKLLFTTIARGLSAVFPQYKQNLSKTLQDHKTIVDQNLRDQWDMLILKPLPKSYDQGSSPQAIFIILDALDECESDGRWHPILRFLQEIGTLRNVPLRLLVTSRPEHQLRRGFQDIANALLLEIEVLGKIPLAEPDAPIEDDITKFLKKEFDDLRTAFGMAETWPSIEKIHLLAKRANGLFIHAATSVRFLRSANISCLESRLGSILLEYPYATSPQHTLDQIYTQILKESMLKDVLECEKEVISGDFKRLMGAILCLAHPISLTELHHLISFPVNKIESIFGNLHSILTVPGDDQNQPIDILHLSFRDFLISRDRCQEESLRINEEDTHYFLFKECIHSSRRDLQENDETHKFLRVHLIHWLEAMGILRCASEAILAINSLIEITNSAPKTEIRQLIREAKRFAMLNREIMETHPLQFYASGITFAPKDSLVRKYFSSGMPKWLLSDPETRSHWSDLLQVFYAGIGDGHLISMAFSLDGKFIVAYRKIFSEDGQSFVVIVWKISNGAKVQFSISGPPIANLTFFPGLSQILVLLGDPIDDKGATNCVTLQLWDAETGIKIKQVHVQVAIELMDNCRPVFALDGMGGTPRDLGQDGYQYFKLRFRNGFLVLSDGLKVGIWNTLTTGQILVLKGIFSVTPSGLTGKEAGTKLNTSDTGEYETDEKHFISSIAIFPMRTIAAAAVDHKRIVIFDMTIGRKLQTITVGDNFSLEGVLDISPDGGILAMRASDTIDNPCVMLWSCRTWSFLKLISTTCRQYPSSEQDILFTPDSEVIAIQGSDEVHMHKVFATVKHIDPKSAADFSSQMDPVQQLLSIDKMRVSPNSKIAVSGKSSGYFQVWDLQDRCIKYSFTAQNMRRHDFNSGIISFSKDSKMVAISAGEKAKVACWDISTTPSESLDLHALEIIKSDPCSRLNICFRTMRELTLDSTPQFVYECFDLGTERQGKFELPYNLDSNGKVSPCGTIFAIEGRSIVSNTYCLILCNSPKQQLEKSETKSDLEWIVLPRSDVIFRHATFSHDGKLLVASSHENFEANSIVGVWELQDYSSTEIILDDKYMIQGLVLSKDKEYLAISTVTMVLICSLASKEIIGRCAMIEWLERKKVAREDVVWEDSQKIHTVSFPLHMLSQYAPRFSRRFCLRGSWLCDRFEKILWFNQEYSPNVIVEPEDDNLVVIGTSGEGRVLFLEID
ncbi:hypothetical protein TWF694_006658 [Orbilia ellipsospora]|uniref:Nephrocystin 3-like N-terminal domain-containing protein n=1 Tax=Orbilia ellipsospora TaxID=2528407 RepID=A0AAV9XLP5_9PEZI